MEKQTIETTVYDAKTYLDIPAITLVLENGQALLDEFEKAQQQMAELKQTLERIKKFNPVFHQK